MPDCQKSFPEPWSYDLEKASIFDADGKLVASQVSRRDAERMRLRIIVARSEVCGND